MSFNDFTVVITQTNCLASTRAA